MSGALVVSQSRLDDWDLIGHLERHRCPRTVPCMIWEAGAATWNHGDIRAQATAKSHVRVHYPGVVFIAPVITKGSVDAWGMVRHQIDAPG